MKRIFLIVVLGLITECILAQQYYNMWRGSGEAGKPEWVANLSMATSDRVTGIDFTTSSTCRGFVNGSGKWGFRKPGTRLDTHSLSNIINGISNLTVGVEGWICPEGLSVRQLWDGATNTLDLLTTGNRSNITSNGDSEGLHIRSAVGNKVYVYGKLYFDDQHWSTIGAGRNNDPTIDNPNMKMLRIGSKDGIGFWGDGMVGTNDTPNMSLNSNGSVNIGQLSSASGYKLSVAGSLYLQNGNVKTLLGVDSDSQNAWFGTKSNNGLYLGTNNQSSLYIDAGNTNNVYIGLTDTEVANIQTELKTKYKLFVNRGILSEDYSIAPKSSWSDFVFDANYELKNVHELETFIVKNKHLPDVPSAKRIAEEGYSQHDMNRILLQKIEELTLYTIQQQKEIDNLKVELASQK